MVEYECFQRQQREKSSFTCNQKVSRLFPCEHINKVCCYFTIESCPCKMEKKTQLWSSLLWKMWRRLLIKDAFCVCFWNKSCGNLVIQPCAGLSDSCDHKTCLCTHGEDGTKCHEPCTWDCKHYQCARECAEECDRPSYNEPCDKELRCGHTCPGLCGERCMSVCPQCDTEKFMKKESVHPVCWQWIHTSNFYSKCRDGRRLSTNELFFELNCGHIFIVKELDQYMESEGSNVKPKQCPKCHKSIITGNRYGNAINKAMSYVEILKSLMLE